MSKKIKVNNREFETLDELKSAFQSVCDENNCLSLELVEAKSELKAANNEHRKTYNDLKRLKAVTREFFVEMYR